MSKDEKLWGKHINKRLKFLIKYQNKDAKIKLYREYEMQNIKTDRTKIC